MSDLEGALRASLVTYGIPREQHRIERKHMELPKELELQQSPQIDLLAAALSAAQADLKHASMDAVNPGFKRNGQNAKYADLSDVIDAIRAPFASNGLSYVQFPSSTEDAAVVVTMLMHKSGQWLRSTLSLPVTQKTAQGFGSAITYARRYALSAMAGLAQIDDDGAGSGNKKRGEEIPEDVYMEHARALESAPDLNTLRVRFSKAHKACEKDQVRLAQLMVVKDARKRALEAA